MKKKGFIAGIVEQYKKGRKVVEDYQAGSAEREQKRAEDFKKKTALLKQKTQYEKAKSDYRKAKGGGSMFGGGGSMFGGGSSAPMFQGTIGSGGNGYGAASWGVGMADKAPMKRKKRKAKPKYKKVVYYR